MLGNMLLWLGFSNYIVANVLNRWYMVNKIICQQITKFQNMFWNINSVHIPVSSIYCIGRISYYSWVLRCPPFLHLLHMFLLDLVPFLVGPLYSCFYLSYCGIGFSPFYPLLFVFTFWLGSFFMSPARYFSFMGPGFCIRAAGKIV